MYSSYPVQHKVLHTYLWKEPKLIYNKKINIICFPKKVSLKLTFKSISSKGQVQKKIKYYHLPSNYSSFKIWRTK